MKQLAILYAFLSMTCAQAMNYTLVTLPERDELAQKALDAGFSEHFLQKTDILSLAGKKLAPQGICLRIDGCAYEYMELRKASPHPKHLLEIVSANLLYGKNNLKEALLKNHPAEIKKLKDEGLF